jgi:hypothetical protein
MDLTKEVDKYASMAGDDHNNVSDSSSEEDTDDNESEGRRGNAPIDTEIDSEREQADEVMVDECEAWAERELDEKDLHLEPISIAER